MAERNSEVDKSTGKTDLAFAERHANIESVFAECEKMIDLLFTEDDLTVAHSAIPFNISAFNPMSVQTGLVCSQLQYLVDELVPKEKFERIDYLFGQLMKGVDHLFNKYEERFDEFFAKYDARLEYLGNGKRGRIVYSSAKID
jgi:hypothetical protein